MIFIDSHLWARYWIRNWSIWCWDQKHFLSSCGLRISQTDIKQIANKYLLLAVISPIKQYRVIWENITKETKFSLWSEEMFPRGRKSETETQEWIRVSWWKVFWSISLLFQTEKILYSSTFKRDRKITAVKQLKKFLLCLAWRM